MSCMFLPAEKFNRNVSSWDVRNVEDMSYMFSIAFIFNQTLQSWNISSVQTMDDMFSYAVTFNQDLECCKSVDNEGNAQSSYFF
jgi:surface protein